MPGLDDFNSGAAAPLPEPAFTPTAPPPSLGVPPLQAPQIPVLPSLPPTTSAAPAGPGNTPPAPAAPLGPAPKTADEAAAREYAAAGQQADIAGQQAANVAQQADQQAIADQKTADLKAQQAADVAAEQERQRKGMDAATRERDALRQSVKDYKFHNFLDDKSAAQEVLGGIGIILGGFSYNPQHQNEAVKIIDNAIARDFDRQKAELDKKFQQAQAAGEDVNQLRAQYAQDEGRMKLRQETQLNALAAQLEAQASRSKNQAGVLKANELAAQARAMAEHLGAAGVKAVADAHSQKLKDAETQSATVKNYAEASRAREGAKGDKATKAEMLANGTVDKAFENEKKTLLGSARTPGPLAKLSSAESIIDGLKGAIDSGDPSTIKEAVVSAREQATRALTGASPTKLTVELQSELQSTPDALKAKLSHLIGNPTESKAFATRVLGLMQGIAEENRKQVDDHRSRINAEWLGPNGKAGRMKSPELNDAIKRAAVGNIDNIFSQVRNADGSPRYSGQAAPAAAAPAAKSQAPVSSTTKKLKLPDGTVAEFDASGKRVK